MRYNALLFCPDEKTARVVTQVLTDLEFRVEPCNEPFAAVKKLMAEHFDAIVVDCDSEQNAALLFKSAHNSGSNQSSLAVAVVEGQSGVAKAFRIGANLVLTKPINVEQSKGTLRVARGLLRKTDAAKPTSPTPAVQPPQRPVTNIDARRPSAPRPAESRPAFTPLPSQPPPSPIPSVSASLFEVEADDGPKPEPTEAAFLESMSDPTPPPTPAAREYPWQPVSKPAAEPMANALRHAAEATGRSEADSSPANKILSSAAIASDAPASKPFNSAMSSGQAAATAPAKESPKPDSNEHAEIPQVEAPAFTSLGGASAAPESGGSKKIILIAAAVVAAAAIGYIGWTKMHPASETPAPQTVTAPMRTAPVQAQPPMQAAVPPSANSAPTTATQTMPSHSTSALPVEQGPDITLSTGDTPPAPKKSTPLIAPNTVIRTPTDTSESAPIVVKNEVSNPAPATPAPQEATPPPPGSLDVASNANDQAISGIMSSTGTTLPQQAPPTLKVSQGVSQGLLIKSVPPAYPQQARQMHKQGAVELMANIGKDGSITSVKLISGDSLLARAAIDAVKQWKYKPYYLDDQPVEIQTQITVNFKLP
jgi:periplasmic protein TonB